MSFPFIVTGIFTAGLPMFLLSFALVSWSLHRGWFAGDSVKEIQDQMDALGKAQKDKKQRRQMDPVLHKWFQFGGGFYGVVALFTWLYIEWDDVANFLQGLADIIINFNPGALIGLVIELFIESIMNFVWAIAWPAFWLNETRDAWLLLFIAYGGYWLGIKAARHAADYGWVERAIQRLRGE